MACQKWELDTCQAKVVQLSEYNTKLIDKIQQMQRVLDPWGTKEMDEIKALSIAKVSSSPASKSNYNTGDQDLRYQYENAGSFGQNRIVEVLNEGIES